jgi:hypothetical protein
VNTKPIAPKAAAKVCCGLSGRGGVNFHGIDSRIGTALCQHERNDSRSRADVQDSLGFRNIRPCAEQYTVSPDFHGALIMPNGKLFESEVGGHNPFGDATPK